MVRLDPAQEAEFNERGWVVVPAPWPQELTDQCIDLARKCERDPKYVAELDTAGNHFKLAPPLKGSYWCALDMAEPFVHIMTHPDVVEIGQQLAHEEDVWIRNGGINELAPGRSVNWHHDGGDDTVEFMHYFSGATKMNGCLRVLSGSHRGPTVPRLAIQQNQAKSVYEQELEQLRNAAGYPRDQHPTFSPEDVAMPNETFIELRPDQLLVRSTRIFHGTCTNHTSHGRLMSHWGFKITGDAIAATAPAATGRMRFEEYLTPRLIASLTPAQQNVLRIGRHFELDPVFEKERRASAGKVVWGMADEAVVIAFKPAHSSSDPSPEWSKAYKPRL